MNARERFLETLRFGKPDRIPFSPGGGRESTRARWHREGLPEGEQDITGYAYRAAGGVEKLDPGLGSFPISERMIPEFEEKVIERKERTQIVQDWKGNICEISNEFDTRYLRNAYDFVTRRWIKCPVESRSDWEAMKQRYDAEDPSRLAEDAAELGRRMAERDYPVGFHFSGPFWQLREWVGFENLCMMFIEDPDFVREMLGFWQEYVARLIERGLEYVKPDMVHLSEDMAYKKFSMISPAMCREFLLPVWQRWGQIVREAGVPIYAIDSDGYIGELIPIWMEAGVNCCDPIEVAAGNDINEFRRRFGKNMAYRGGVDKRAMAKGGKAIEGEIARLRPVIEGGGYIPGCDHGVPADVSWPDFVRYVGLLARATGWL